MAHTVRDQFSAEDLKVLKSYNFLTLKPFIYALNVSQDDLVNAEAIKSEYSEKLHAPVAVVCVKTAITYIPQITSILCDKSL